jgi:flagellar FliL protein
MAEAKKAEGGEAEQPPPKKKSKLILIIVAAVVALALIAGGAFFMLKKNAAHDEEEDPDAPPAKEQKAKKGKKDAAAPPVYVKLEVFTVKLQVEAQEAYLQAVPELRVLDLPVGEKIKQYNPEIRHKILLIMSGKKASEIGNPDGVQKLANEIRVAINLIIDPPPPKRKGAKGADEAPGEAKPDDPVQAVLFTSFIVQ